MENEIDLETEENINLSGIKNDSPKINSSEVTEVLSNKITDISSTSTPPECEIVEAGNSNLQQSTIQDKINQKFINNDGNPIKIKRKRRRGKPKGNSSKPFKKSNWKFQMPQRYRSGCGGGPLARPTLERSHSIVPYNTNKFLMEEHMAEVPSALLTPSGRTRDSSFSVDSEDNYFFSLPEDEEEFLTKEFSNVYERARVERLENLNKQQLIEECLQIEDRYSQFDVKQQQKYSTEFLNKIRFLEERVRELNKENLELRRKVDNISINSPPTTSSSHNNINGGISNNIKPEPMCASDCSEDSESDSSSSSSSSSSSHSSSVSEYSVPHSPAENGQQQETDETNPYSQQNGNNGYESCNELTHNGAIE